MKTRNQLISFDRDKEAEAIRKLFNSSVSGFIEIGKRLLECKSHLGHGEFRSWLKDEFRWSERMAQRYIQGYKKFGIVTQVVEGVANPPHVTDLDTSNCKPRLQITFRSLSQESKLSSKTKKPAIKPEVKNPVESKDEINRLQKLVKEQNSEIKRLMTLLDQYNSDDKSHKINLMQERLSYLESMEEENAFISSSYKLVRGLIMEHDPEYWFEIVKILGKKNLYLG